MTGASVAPWNHIVQFVRPVGAETVKHSSASSLTRYAAMQPAQVKQPFHREGRIYEEKIDGWRMLAYKSDRTVRLEGRNGVAWSTSTFTTSGTPSPATSS